MKTTLASTQFDQPNLTAAPATPSCCCCCCCCLATIVSTSVIGATSVRADAREMGVAANSPTLLAALTPLIGLGAAILSLFLGLTWPIALAAAALTLGACWVGAFQIAGNRGDEALPRAFKYGALFMAAFAVEVVVGGILLVLYVLPYILVGTLICVFVIRSHLDGLRRRANGGPEFDTPVQPGYLLPAPPTGPGPTKPPAGPLAQQPMPEPPKP